MWNSIVGLLAGLIQSIYEFTVSVGSPSYGLAIILFTAILRVLMFPLSMMQAKSTRAMALLQPRMKKLEQQYKNSPEIYNREMQALYRKYKVNPLSGCLPMLIQMPILFALFSALRDFQYAGDGATFFWITNLSDPDPTGIVLPLIVGLSSYLQSKQSMDAQPPTTDQAKTMNMVMLYGMPVMMIFMTRGFAAGLAIYWSVFNILGYLMQIVINAQVKRSHETMKANMEAEDAKAKEEQDRKASREAKAEKLAIEADQGDFDYKPERKRTASKKKMKVNRGRIKQRESTKGKELDFDD
ncbi:MAG: membrane protein insertase YidC [Clostridiales bacterium]|nr:membrane protein insertase YidC [Clostridiales bacterium]